MLRCRVVSHPRNRSDNFKAVPAQASGLRNVPTAKLDHDIVKILKPRLSNKPFVFFVTVEEISKLMEKYF